MIPRERDEARLRTALSRSPVVLVTGRQSFALTPQIDAVSAEQLLSGATELTSPT